MIINNILRLIPIFNLNFQNKSELILLNINYKKTKNSKLTGNSFFL